MKNHILKVAIATCTLALVAVACADGQGRNDASFGNDFRMGVYWPSSAGAKAAGKTWLALGFDHKLEKSLLNYGGYAQSISIDYMAKNDNRSIPVLLKFGMIEWADLKFDVGIGGAVTKVATFSDKIEFAAAASLSYQQKGWPVFLQAKYYFTGKDDFRGLSAFVGYKF